MSLSIIKLTSDRTELIHPYFIFLEIFLSHWFINIL